MAEILLNGEGVAEYDQRKAAVLDALRKEDKAWFALIGPEPDNRFAWFVNVESDPDEAVQFLRTVIASARSELADIHRQMGVSDGAES